jgi:hypothetical protein
MPELPDSPSKNTRLQKHLRSPSPSPTPVLQSPPRKRPKNAALTDLDVWEWSDEKILGKYIDSNILEMFISDSEEASKKKWTSKLYDHFTVTLSHVQWGGNPHHIDYIFTCKDDPINCHITRGHMQTSDGTTNIGRKC